MSQLRARSRKDRPPTSGAEDGSRGAEARARVAEFSEPPGSASHAEASRQQGDDAPGFDGTYRVQLAQFEGPLDLLLHLIQQHELDILDIPVGFVTKKYLEYLAVMRTMSIDIASEYLVMAATLAHIKSRMLLPAPPPGQDDALPGEEELDPREELVRRLLEYQKYKAAAADLSGRERTLGRDVFVRGMKEDVPEGLAPFAETGVFSLFDAFEKVLERANIKLDHEVVFDRISITDRMLQLTERLTVRKAMRFEELFDVPVTPTEPGMVPAGFTRFDLIITFLALLEMCRLKVARVYQSDPLAPIHIELAVQPDEVSQLVERDAAPPAASSSGDPVVGAADGQARAGDREPSSDAEASDVADGALDVE